MAAIRRNIEDSALDRQRFIEGVLALKSESVGLRASQVGIGAGPRADDADLSWWDLFVIWHAWSMAQTTGGGRNAAHSGPVFLPWHRWFMLILEIQMRNVLGLNLDDFGLPYWDWASDGDRPVPNQGSAPVFDIVGGDGNSANGEVTSGPFSPANGFVVNVEDGPSNTVRATQRPLRRQIAVVTNALPTSGEMERTSRIPDYDAAPWNQNSELGFRNALEGWSATGHNQVHVFVGGDMLTASSPNDPIFFLNHCNVDRLWAQWQRTSPNPDFVPTGLSPAGDELFRHRSQDPIYSILTRSQPSVGSMQDVSAFYGYDTIIV